MPPAPIVKGPVMRRGPPNRPLLTRTAPDREFGSVSSRRVVVPVAKFATMPWLGDRGPVGQATRCQVELAEAGDMDSIARLKNSDAKDVAAVTEIAAEAVSRGG